MNQTFKLIIPLLIAIVVLTACNDDPTSIGSNLIPDNDKILFKEFDTKQTPVRQTSSFFEKDIELGNAERLLLGKNNFSEAVILYRFNIFLNDSLVNYLKNNKLSVNTAWLDMFPKYWLGDNTSNFDLSAHQIRSYWEPLSFTKVSLSQLSYDANNVAFSKSVTDTLVKFNIQPQVIFEWLKYQVDSNSAPKNYGVLLKPTPNTQRYFGFDAYQYGVENKQSKLHLVLQKTTGVKDTISVTPFIDTYILTGAKPVNDGNNFYLQGAMSLRSSLFFDVSSLPKDIIISKATLELSCDSLKSLDGNPKSDSILVQMFKDSTDKNLTADSSVYTLLTKSGDLFEGDITWIVQKWLSGTDNQGVMLSLVDEKTSAARIVIYGSKNSNLSLRPRLKLIYLQKK